MKENIVLIDGQEFDSETGELINKVEQVEVEVIEDELPLIVCNGGTHIQTNTEQLEKELKIYLTKFDIDVTAETEKDEKGNILSIGEKDASKKATELNKLSIDLDKKRKLVAKEIKKPADSLKTSIDSLMSLIQIKRTAIIEKVNVFKDARFNTIRQLLTIKMNGLFLEYDVNEEYQFLDIEPLVVEGSLGKTNLTKKVIEQLTGMVLKQKNIQDNVKIRTLELSKTCIDSGLEIEISFSQVESIIKEPDYDERLKVMINSQLEVEERVKENAKKQEELREIEKDKQIEKDRIRLEKEKQDALDKQKREFEAEQNRLKQEEINRLEKIRQDEENERLRLEKIETDKLLKIEIQRKEEEQAGKRIVKLCAFFELEVDNKFTNEMIVEKFKKELEEYSKTFKSIEVV